MHLGSRLYSPDDGGSVHEVTTVVAVDKDKNSNQAVKWAVDHLLGNMPLLVLIHVKIITTPNSMYLSSMINIFLLERIISISTGGFVVNDISSEVNFEVEPELNQLFVPYRGFCARKAKQLKEVILESTDISKALLEYITSNGIQNIVVGASSRSSLMRRFRPDVSQCLMKSAPDYCSVYVIYKGKAITIKPAKGPNSSVSSSLPPRKKSPVVSPRDQRFDSLDEGSGSNWRGSVPPSPIVARLMPLEHRMQMQGYMPSPGRETRPLSNARTAPHNALYECIDSSSIGHRSSSRETSFSDEFDLPSPTMDFNSMDFGSSLDSSSSDSSAAKDVEAEMRRLKLELKQTMDMYNNACREAIMHKQKVEELSQIKSEEQRKVEELKQAEAGAMAMVEMEKAKCRAAIEAAEKAKRIAELEAHKRQKAELRARKEAEERRRATNVLNNVDVRYRRYTIEEIEFATNNFAQSLKIGEGGYGPVYKALLDHTQVAIKVLRPDASQGRKQFQQEVEVLSCIRHPNMVLLLGACPEYGCLVYEYMDYGSLEDRLFRRGGTMAIPWGIRFKISFEIATGLLFLHQAKPEPLVHRDLKPANILLDHNFVAKIADVGLARLVPPQVADTVTQYRMTSTAGTFCYIDPEYQQTGMLGTKSDIYSLGVMLLQIITARPPMGLSHQVERSIERGTFKEILDPAVPDWPVEEALSYAKLALWCVELRRKDRPDLAKEILPELYRLKEIAELS
ncbi:U-box domain-containing protein 52 [Carex littledalei]|uniref:RING-type E3 ubiquitin transferase n=1 Tax=Carex littledalei TaxID=544730 RepID=A0A833VC63_9POAL|nr:U-box domain-containing protein 52 [Carex littledalei]